MTASPGEGGSGGHNTASPHGPLSPWRQLANQVRSGAPVYDGRVPTDSPARPSASPPADANKRLLAGVGASSLHLHALGEADTGAASPPSGRGRLRGSRSLTASRASRSMRISVGGASGGVLEAQPPCVGMSRSPDARTALSRNSSTHARRRHQLRGAGKGAGSIAAGPRGPAVPLDTGRRLPLPLALAPVEGHAALLHSDSDRPRPRSRTPSRCASSAWQRSLNSARDDCSSKRNDEAAALLFEKMGELAGLAEGPEEPQAWEQEAAGHVHGEAALLATSCERATTQRSTALVPAAAAGHEVPGLGWDPALAGSSAGSEQQPAKDGAPACDSAGKGHNLSGAPPRAVLAQQLESSPGTPRASPRLPLVSAFAAPAELVPTPEAARLAAKLVPKLQQLQAQAADDVPNDGASRQQERTVVIVSPPAASPRTPSAEGAVGELSESAAEGGLQRGANKPPTALRRTVSIVEPGDSLGNGGLNIEGGSDSAPLQPAWSAWSTQSPVCALRASMPQKRQGPAVGSEHMRKVGHGAAGD
eukprot:355101-Chlamydomonas_euryale.AAC.5